MGLTGKTVKFNSAEGLGDFRLVRSSIDEGDFYNGSELKDLSAHTATHVDAPSHFINVGAPVSHPCSGACAVPKHIEQLMHAPCRMTFEQGGGWSC